MNHNIPIGRCSLCKNDSSNCKCFQKSINEMIESGVAKILTRPLNIQTIDGCVLHILDILDLDKRDKDNKDKVKKTIESYLSNWYENKNKLFEKYQKDAKKYYELKRLLK